MPDFQNARLDWDASGQPLSSEFGDLYFSREDGLAETRHVFLMHNDLPARFARLAAGEQLVIGETGFGTGLNFLCAWQLFEQTADADSRLHFVSVEKFPLAAPDLRRALALWPELADYARQLEAQYLAIHPGFQRLVLAGGRVILTLLIGDVLECLPELDARIDAWFLDGFAPAKNPQMWNAELFAELARLSAPGASLATFTSAGFVRRGLIDAGFDMQRVKGFGQKREMLAGHFTGAPAAAGKPWYARPAPAPERTALVIGAGLAGCSAAASLAWRGWRVQLLERQDGIARETSGNPQGVLYLKLSAHHTALSRLVLSGFGYTRRLLHGLQADLDWQGCGVLQLATSDQEAARQAQLAAAFPPDLLHPIDREAAQARAGIALPAGGLFFPEGGWVHPPALCRLLAATPGVELRLHRQALRIRRQGKRWQALDDQGQVLGEAAVLILAGAAEVNRFEETAELPLKRIRGQITRLPATAASATLKTVVCGEGYVAPARDGEHTLGASFRFDSDCLVPSAEENRENLGLLQEISPDLAQRLGVDQLDPGQLQGRAGMRCTSPDYLPLVGPVANAAAFADSYQLLTRNARAQPEAPCPWHEGLYVTSAHGSRGLLSAPLAGELLAGWLNDEPLPVPGAVAEACHPNRFAVRSLSRGTARQQGQ